MAELTEESVHIEVHRDTWRLLRKLKAEMDAKSIDEVIKRTFCKHEKGEYIGKLTDPGPYYRCKKCGVAFKEGE